MALTESEKVDLIRTAYHALSASGSEAASAGLTSLSELLVDAVGDENAHQLMVEWTSEGIAEGTGQGRSPNLRELALQGLGFYFASAGMPVEWARRHLGLFQHMPPLGVTPSGADRVSRRQAARRARNWRPALDAGDALIASAILSGNVAGVFAHAAENLSILRAWKATDPEIDHTRGMEDYEWLRDHAPALARWGAVVQQQLRCG